MSGIAPPDSRVVEILEDLQELQTQLLLLRSSVIEVARAGTEDRDRLARIDRSVAQILDQLTKPAPIAPQDKRSPAAMRAWGNALIKTGIEFLDLGMVLRGRKVLAKLDAPPDRIVPPR